MLIPKIFILLERSKPHAAGILTSCGFWQDRKAPDHSTIARFRTGFLADACENLFYQMVHRLDESGELLKETVFIDGTKLEASANKYTFVWEKIRWGNGKKRCSERYRMLLLYLIRSISSPSV